MRKGGKIWSQSKEQAQGKDIFINLNFQGIFSMSS